MKIDCEKLRIPFDGCDSVDENYSQASQDIFVLSCLNGKKNGTFLDLGCGYPFEINNTYLLEKNFGWSGLSVDIDSKVVSLHNQNRKSPALSLDATNIDFDMVLSYFKSNHIDYLSLDLEPATTTLAGLKNIPFDKVEFSVITFEHDSYRFENDARDASREIFERYGYKCICLDVSNGYNIYEDWYYNPKFVNYDDIKILGSEQKEWVDILFV